MECLRYDEGYPILVNRNPAWPNNTTPILPPGVHTLNYVACSGAKTQDVLDWQLLDEPAKYKPNPIYGKIQRDI
jgi:hypothetical protein